MPSPRNVEVSQADIAFHDRLDIELGRVNVRVRHVGGDHSPDSSVMYVEPDRVLSLGDCLGGSPEGALTAESAFPLCEVILEFDAELYVDGHEESVFSRPEMEDLIEKMRLAEHIARDGSSATELDEDTRYFVQAFKAGRKENS
jgi:glyoxylase-like metal-dependent hydrolase (beta-lactamase superfamily II)